MMKLNDTKWNPCCDVRVCVRVCVWLYMHVTVCVCVCVCDCFSVASPRQSRCYANLFPHKWLFLTLSLSSPRVSPLPPLPCWLTHFRLPLSTPSFPSTLSLQSLSSSSSSSSSSFLYFPFPSILVLSFRSRTFILLYFVAHFVRSCLFLLHYYSFVFFSFVPHLYQFNFYSQVYLLS